MTARHTRSQVHTSDVLDPTGRSQLGCGLVGQLSSERNDQSGVSFYSSSGGTAPPTGTSCRCQPVHGPTSPLTSSRPAADALHQTSSRSPEERCSVSWGEADASTRSTYSRPSNPADVLLLCLLAP